MTRRQWTGVALAALLLGTAGCETTTSPSLVPAGSPAASDADTSRAGGTAAPRTALGADVNREIAQLRRFLAPFHDLEKAIEFGYDTPSPAPGVCISDPARGGMGYHYTMSSRDLVTDGEVSLLEPEFLVYSPQEQGGVRLSAVDYFVPYDTWTDAEPPSLLGVPFHAEDGFQAWVLHIWAFWPNPAGMFENYNPDVPLCPA